MKGNGFYKRLEHESMKNNTNEFVLINHASKHEQNGEIIISGVIMFPPDSIYHGGKFNVKIIRDAELADIHIVSDKLILNLLTRFTFIAIILRILK